MLQFLPYALAAYGGYKGYKASKEAGGSGLQRLLGAGTGAALGYYGGKMIPGVGAAGFGNVASANYIPTFSQLRTYASFLSGSACTWSSSLGLSNGRNSCSKQDQLHKWFFLLCLQELVKFQQQVQQQAHLFLCLVVAYLIFSNHKMLKVKWLMIH
jgi:hypothetical protein